MVQGQLTWIANFIWGQHRVAEYEPDSEPRESERVPLLEAEGSDVFLCRKVLPYAPDAWHDPDKVKIGHKINFNRYFYKPQPLRSLEEIRTGLLAVEQEAAGLLDEILGEVPK